LVGVGGDDAVELALGGAEMVPDQFSQDGAVIDGGLEITFRDRHPSIVGDAEQGADRSLGAVTNIPVGPAQGRIVDEIAAVGATVDAATRHVHDAGFGVVGPSGGVFSGGASELGHGD